MSKAKKKAGYVVSRNLERQRLPLARKYRQLTLDGGVPAGHAVGLEGLTPTEDRMLEGLIRMLAETGYKGNRTPTITERATLPVLVFSPAQLFEAMSLPPVRDGHSDRHRAAIEALRGLSVKEFYVERESGKQRGRRVWRAEPLYRVAAMGAVAPDGARRVDLYEVTFSTIFVIGVLDKPLNYIRKPETLYTMIDRADPRRRHRLTLLYRAICVHTIPNAGAVRLTLSDLADMTQRGKLYPRHAGRVRRELESDLTFLSQQGLIEWEAAPMGAAYDIELMPLDVPSPDPDLSEAEAEEAELARLEAVARANERARVIFERIIELVTEETTALEARNAAAAEEALRGNIGTAAELEAVLKEVDQLMAAMIAPDNRKLAAEVGLAIATLAMFIAEKNLDAARWYAARRARQR